MATYQFRSQDGEIIERDYPMRSAPSIGTSILVNGKRYTRVLCDHHLDANLADKCRGYPKRSIAAPQFSGKGVPGITHDHKGHVVFRNPQAKREYCRANPDYSTDLG